MVPKAKSATKQCSNRCSNSRSRGGANGLLESRELNTQFLFLLAFLPFGPRGRYHKTHMHFDAFDYVYMMQNQLKEWIKAEIVRRGRDLESVTPPPPPQVKILIVDMLNAMKYSHFHIESYFYSTFS